MPDLHYNFRWIESTFSSRSVTESLLAPEREAGNVSSNDYDAAVNFSPGFHPFYRYIGAILGVPLAFAFRRPSWTQTRTYAFGFASVLGGSLAGQAMSLSSHLRFIRSLEDPSGFGQAIENIQKNSGMPVPPGPTIVMTGSKWAVDSDPPPPETSTTESITPSASVSDTAKPSMNPQSKWDQIRAGNSRTSTQSSWDALRQNHERSRVPSPATSGSGPTGFQRSRDEDRALEQAKFDEMLERERNIRD
ncbi:hypothetical protein H0H92_004651 [Tricholoma furcatifolium]|nr:hypothetical protein H0H92_004651 [Tricholoma furcatifolium]